MLLLLALWWPVWRTEAFDHLPRTSLGTFTNVDSETVRAEKLSLKRARRNVPLRADASSGRAMPYVSGAMKKTLPDSPNVDGGSAASASRPLRGGAPRGACRAGRRGSGGARPGDVPVEPANGPAADYPVVVGDPFTVDGVTYTPKDSMNFDAVGFAAASAAIRASTSSSAGHRPSTCNRLKRANRLSRNQPLA